MNDRNPLDEIASHVAKAIFELNIAMSLCKPHEDEIWCNEIANLLLWSDIYHTSRKAQSIHANLFGGRYSTNKEKKVETNI